MSMADLVCPPAVIAALQQRNPCVREGAVSYICARCPMCGGNLSTDIYNRDGLVCLLCSREWIVESGRLVQPMPLPPPISLVGRAARMRKAVAG